MNIRRWTPKLYVQSVAQLAHIVQHALYYTLDFHYHNGLTSVPSSKAMVCLAVSVPSESTVRSQGFVFTVKIKLMKNFVYKAANDMNNHLNQ